MRLTISSRNWLFRWAYLFTAQDRRDCIKHTTLCDLFWRAVLLTPFQIAVFAAPVVWFFFMIALHGWFEFARAIGVVLCIALGLVSLIAFLVWLEEDAVQSKPVEWVSEAYSGFKDRYCPLVRVEQR